MKLLRPAVVFGAALAALVGCASAPDTPLHTVDHLDVPRFMGRWYVIACIPTRIERSAFDAVESYELRPDGRVATTFTFRAGSHDGPPKAYHPVATVLDATHARWGMQFIWPFKADYRIAYINGDYSEVIVARSARDYVWIMARNPRLPSARYQDLVRRVRDIGYDVSKLRNVPQG